MCANGLCGGRGSLPSWLCGFDSRHPLSHDGCGERGLRREPCSPKNRCDKDMAAWFNAAGAELNHAAFLCCACRSPWVTCGGGLFQLEGIRLRRSRILLAIFCRFGKLAV